MSKLVNRVYCWVSYDSFLAIRSKGIVLAFLATNALQRDFQRTHAIWHTLALRGLEEPFFQLFCCVVLVFDSCGSKVFDLLSVCWVRGSGDYDRKTKIQSSVWRVVLLCQFLVLVGN